MQVVLCEISENPMKNAKHKYALQYSTNDVGQKFNGRPLYLALQREAVDPHLNKAGESRKWK